MTKVVVVAFVLSLFGCGGEDEETPAVTRTYYIAADEVAWDYAPSGINLVTGLPFDDVANVFVQNGPDRIGKVYIKALFREYTDATFTKRAPENPAWSHLGTLGPVIRATVGDRVDVVFKNNTTFPRSVHAHGLQYDKSSEGAPYHDDADHSDDVIEPGATFTYHYNVPERAGPGPGDGSSIMWMYHSHVDEPRDINSGLVGPIIITARDHTLADGTPDDVDRELVVLFEVMDENNSTYLEQNIQMFAGDPASVDPEDPDFQESNLMHSINGYVYGNLPGLTMKLGERVRWYLMGMGTEVDLHTPHWHGQTVLEGDVRTDVIELLPASMKMADMVPDERGRWLFHCHVHDHIDAGMLALFDVN